MVPGVGDINVGVSVDGDILHEKKRKQKNGARDGTRLSATDPTLSKKHERRRFDAPDDGTGTSQSRRTS